ncbi:MOSC domain-containing protein [Tateyamaria pelophila]|uniref:MOSC domain-containing protein n=1 Tax=Tateyamaria pelophila TaxID=328415 RepID=UPI001CBF1DF2|nr:MOSC domain-containing protein [Tateyamaria pelophila]
MTGEIRRLFHYPIKGLNAQPLDHVALAKGEGFPLDRAFGFARPNSGFDPDNPRPLPKTRFVVLARDAGLATLRTRYDQALGTLTLKSAGKDASFDVEALDGRAAAAAFLVEHLGLEPDMLPTLYSAAPHKFTDVSVVSPEMMNAVSLINLDSVAHFGEAIGADVAAARFRANILFSGVPPMAELEWVGREITIGAARFKIVRRTKRCPATQVNLETGMRDLDVPKLLRDQFGHSDMGVYAEVLQGGRIAPGDVLRLV